MNLYNMPIIGVRFQQKRDRRIAKLIKAKEKNLYLKNLFSMTPGKRFMELLEARRNSLIRMKDDSNRDETDRLLAKIEEYSWLINLIKKSVSAYDEADMELEKLRKEKL